MIPLIVALWEGAGYHGRKRLLVEDTPNLELQGFNDQTHAVEIHPGPDYAAWQAAHGGQPPFAVVYADNDYEGKGWVLAGGLPDLDEAGIGGISSVRICPPALRATVDEDLLGVIDLNDPARDEFQTVDATIAPVPLVVELFVDAQFQGHRVFVVENSSSLAADFGGEFSGAASSAQVLAGPDFAGQPAVLYAAEGWLGASRALAPGSYPDLRALGFGDTVRSIVVG